MMMKLAVVMSEQIELTFHNNLETLSLMDIVFNYFLDMWAFANMINSSVCDLKQTDNMNCRKVGIVFVL